jgi:hypothetical protein
VVELTFVAVGFAVGAAFGIAVAVEIGRWAGK